MIRVTVLPAMTLPSPPNRSRILAAGAAIIGAGAVLLFWNLGRPYLWQDEAATAVLAQRMIQFGRPLAYDGVNLITIDHAAAEDSLSIEQRTHDPKAAVDFYVQRGDYKRDTTWKWQPWGQFIVAAISFKLLGATTLAARLPFALAALITELVLYQFVLRYFKDWKIAILACTFLVLNAYWILHSRQCRYYALSSFFLLLTLAGYTRWQQELRWGAACFVVAAWCWFQSDYGTVWPVLAILFADAVVYQRHKIWRIISVASALGLAIVPFIFYYELWGRLSVRSGTWYQRFMLNLFNVNEYIAPALMIGVTIALWIHRRKTLPSIEKRLMAIVCSIVLVLFFWIPTVAPAPFLRYSIMTAPLGCLLVAWSLVRFEESSQFRGFAWIGAAVFVFTPWLSLPLHIIPVRQHDATLVRPELSALYRNIFGHPPDPNRVIIDWLRQNAAPTDEILINYEDIPLMFYLPNPVRGGISAFRAEDDAKKPPDFVILRKSADFGHWLVYQRELAQYTWKEVGLEAPDIKCGNDPDPTAQEFLAPGYDPVHAPMIFVARRNGRISSP